MTLLISFTLFSIVLVGESLLMGWETWMIFVIDSGHLSSGQGFMAIEAAKLAEEGYGATEIVEKVMNGHCG